MLRRAAVLLGADVELLDLVEERRALHPAQAAGGFRLVAAVRAERVDDAVPLLGIAALATDGEEISAAGVQLQPAARVGSRGVRRPSSRVGQEEREVILDALRAHGGNQSEAARSLGGMKRTTLLYKIKKLDIRPEEYGRSSQH